MHAVFPYVGIIIVIILILIFIDIDLAIAALVIITIYCSGEIIYKSVKGGYGGRLNPCSSEYFRQVRYNSKWV